MRKDSPRSQYCDQYAPLMFQAQPETLEAYNFISREQDSGIIAGTTARTQVLYLASAKEYDPSKHPYILEDWARGNRPDQMPGGGFSVMRWMRIRDNGLEHYHLRLSPTPNPEFKSVFEKVIEHDDDESKPHMFTDVNHNSGGVVVNSEQGLQLSVLGTWAFKISPEGTFSINSYDFPHNPRLDYSGSEQGHKNKFRIIQGPLGASFDVRVGALKVGEMSDDIDVIRPFYSGVRVPVFNFEIIDAGLEAVLKDERLTEKRIKPFVQAYLTLGKPQAVRKDE